MNPFSSLLSRFSKTIFNSVVSDSIVEDVSSAQSNQSTTVIDPLDSLVEQHIQASSAMTQLSSPIVISKQDLQLLQYTSSNVKSFREALEAKQAELDQLQLVQSDIQKTNDLLLKALGAQQFIIDLIQQNYELPDESQIDVNTGSVTLPISQTVISDANVIDI